MRKYITLLTASALTLSGLSLSPAHATGVEYDCDTGTTTISGPSYTLTEGVLQAGDDCIGSVIIADGVVTISDSAFQGSNITDVQISSTVTTIRDSAFANTRLTSVSIPNSVTEIDDAAFASNPMLTSFIVGAGNPNYSSDAGVLFNKTRTLLVTYPAAKGTTYVIPDSVSTVGAYSFINQGPENVLRSVVIPASVTAIRPFAFTDDAIDFFFLGPTNPTAGINAFGIAPTGTAYVTVAASASGSFPLTVGKWEGLIVQTGSLVTYDGNGATTGTTPTNVQPLRKSGIPVTVASNSGGLDKSGHVFAGWNTSADGSGTNYLATGSDSLTPSGNVTLYAKWNRIYTVTYSYNSATGGNTVASNSFVTGDTAITLPTPTRTGYTFAGWYSDAGLTSKIADAGSSYSPTGETSAITAYAKWTRNPVKAVATAKPTISGTAKVNKTLTAKKGTWTGYPTPKITYQWYSCSKALKSTTTKIPSSCKKMTGATKSTLKLKSSLKGKYIVVVVSGTSAGTSKVAWLSKSTKRVG